MSVLNELLPAHEGLLPKWLLLLSVVATGSSVQNYLKPSVTERVYSGTDSSVKGKLASPVNALSARTFGTWTFLAAVVRFYAAYDIENPVLYQLALWTFVIAGAHFGSEWLYYGTARMGAGLFFPVLVCCVSLVWMPLQMGYYTG